MTTALVYSTDGTATDTLGWDELVTDPRALAKGLVHQTHVDHRGTTLLLEHFSEDSPTGVTWTVSFEEAVRCDEECRYDVCTHGDRDRSFRFTSEDEARWKFEYWTSDEA